ncbi:MAG: PD-(D/E)XK nuclease family protein [Lentisphaerae bacterium]|nr:PD-(D/E)XK nuclease family protein [Lentisphaerota bacterium]
MPVTRHFLGWNGPVADKVRDHILGLTEISKQSTSANQPLDLNDFVIVVPTHRAGRHLRDCLAGWCHANNTALLSALIVTPQYFFSREAETLPHANPLLALMVWSHTLMRTDLNNLSALFPNARHERTFQWALMTGQAIESMRQELADGALTIRSMLERYRDQLEEPERWQALAMLEELYQSDMASSGFADSCQTKIENASRCRPDINGKTIIIAAVPDPSLLAVEAFRNMAKDQTVQVLIHAPDELSNSFDEWGRPMPNIWRNFEIQMPDWPNNVFLEATPANQSERALKEISRSSTDFESGEIAIGAPDRSIIPFLQDDLRNAGLPAFDPADAPVGKHPLGLLIASISNILQLPSYNAVANLIRHPDFMAYLVNNHNLSPIDVLTQLDQFQNKYMPIGLEQIIIALQKDKRSPAIIHQETFPEFAAAIDVITALLDRFSSDNIESAWRSILEEIYANHNLNPANTADTEFASAAQCIASTLEEFRQLERAGLAINPTQFAQALSARLPELVYHHERSDEVLDMEGWLELPWNNRPFLLVTGMNEDFVPGSSMSDPFLPDSLRHRIGLRDDAARLARDIFLLTGMIQSRHKHGRTCLILGKTTMLGDPLRPTRLFFRCPDKQLPERVRLLLAEVNDRKHRPHATVIFPLKPSRADVTHDIRNTKRISVTSFRDYLECPFRFYLKHFLQMNEINDDKTGLDNADFGTIVHTVLKIMGSDKKLWKSTDPESLGKKLGQLAEEYAIRQFGKSLPLPVQLSLIAASRRLRAVAYEQTVLTSNGWEIEKVEAGDNPAEEARWSIHRQQFTVIGHIDRIDKNSRDGRVRLVDYKTSNNPDEPLSAHLARARVDRSDYRILSIKETKKTGAEKIAQYQWQDLQLPLYAAIYIQGNELPHNLELAYFQIPKSMSQTGISVWPEFNPEILASALSCADEILRRITAGIFWPPAQKTRYEDPFEMMFLNPVEQSFEIDSTCFRPSPLSDKKTSLNQ